MKICIILGTRPEIIKMSPLIRECENKNLDYFIIHRNQHCSENMDEIFFKELKLPKSKYNLYIGSGLHGEQIGKMLIETEKVLLKEKPNIVLVEGDTNTVLAEALAASKLHIKVGHVEAGLRSRDMNMPGEINRIMTDQLSDYLYVPTETAKNNAILENISEKKIFLTGNTIVDAVYQNMNIAKEKSQIIRKLKLEKDNYFLLTFHREENVDNAKKFKSTIKGLEELYRKYKKR